MKLVTVDLFRKLIPLVNYKIYLLLLFGLIFLGSDLLGQSIGTVTVSPTTVCAGSNVSLTFLVTNTNNPISNYFTASTTYIAYLSSSTGGAPWTQIFSGTSSSTPPASNKDASATISLTITIPSLTTPAGTGYRISVGSTSPSFNGSGGANASSGFTINVPSLTGASQSATVCPGSGALINLTGLIAGSTSTVNYSINGVSQIAITGVVANGSGDASFTSANLIAANNGQTLQITGITTTNLATNCTKTFAQNVTLTVHPSPTLSDASQSATVCPGSGALINLTGLLASSTSTVNYTINGAAQTPVAGVVSDGSGASSFTSANLTAANNGQTLQITGITTTSTSPNCTQSFTQNVTLNVHPSPTLAGASQSAIVCAGSGALINLTGLIAGSTSTVNYTINSVAQTPVAGVVADGSGAASFTSANLTAANNGQTLRITGITNTSTTPACTQSFTQDVTLSVNPRPTSVISGTTSICSGVSTTISIALTGTQPWSLSYFDGTTTTPVAGIVSSPYTFNVLLGSTTTYTVTALSDANCASIGADLTGSAIITVHPTPTLSGASQPATACEGSGASINLTGLIAGSTSTVSYSINGVVQTPITGVVANGSGAASFTSAALTYANNGQTLQITEITTTSAAPNCSQSFVQDVTLSVNPAPTLSGASQSAPVCSGSPATINLTGLLASTTSTISYSINGVAQTPVAGVVANASGEASFLSSVLIPSNNGQVLSITGVTTTSSTPNCYASFTQNFNLSVFTTPSITASASASSVCFNVSSQTTSLAYSATTGTPTTYTITWDVTPVNSFVDVVDAPLPASPITIDVPAGALANTYTGTLSVKNDDGCVSSTSSFSVTVNEQPTITLAPTATSICFSLGSQNTPLTYSAPTNSPTLYSIAWDVAPANNFVAVVDAALPPSPISIAVPAGTPAGTYTGNLTVKNAGCVGSTSSFTVTVNALPTITLAASATSVCFSSGAQTTPLTYSGTTETPTTYSITWSGSPSNSFATVTNVTLPASPITINVPAGTAVGTYTGNLTVKNANGCVSSASSFTVTVNALPTITLAASASNVCFSSGAQTTPLTYSATTGTPTTYSITWNVSPSNSFAAVTDVTLPVSPITINVPAGTAVGTYTGNLTVKNANGCVSSSSSFTVTVNALPTITLAASATSVCFSSGAQTTPLTYSGTTGTPTTYSITWDVAPANNFVAVVDVALPSSPITIAIPAGTPAGTYTGYLTVKNANSCVSSVSSFTVIVNALPTITLAASASNVCFSSGAQTTPLTYSATTGTPTTYSITWNGSPSNSFATVTNIALPASPITINVPAGTAVGTYTGNLTVRNANGCVSTSSSFTITVNGRPSPTFTAQPGLFACVGADVTYTTESGQSNYTWVIQGILNTDYSITSGGTSADNTVMLKWLTAGGKTVTINYTNASGCAATSATSSTTTTVYSGAPATPGIISGNESQCEAIAGQIYSIASVSEATSYTWAVPTGWTITAGQGTTSITATAGIFGENGNITVTASNFCGTSPARTLAVTVIALPTITLGTITTVCLGTTTSLLPYSATTQSPNQYSIDFVSGITDVSNATLPVSPISITIPATGLSGAYNGTLTVRNTTTGCVSTGYPVTVSVNAVTSGTAVSPAPVCLNGTALLSPTDATGSGTITYQWQSSPGSAYPGSFTNIPFATSATYSTPPVTTTVYYVRVATSTLNGVPCSATTSVITVSTTGSLSTLRTDGIPNLADWKNPLAWLNGQVPGIDQGTLGCPVTVINELVLDNTFSGTTNLQIQRGVVLIDANVTDENSPNLLLMGKPGNNDAESVLDIKSGTVTFLGGANISTSTLIIRSGAALILGPTPDCKCIDILGYDGDDGILECENELNKPTVPSGNMLFLGNGAKIIIEQGAVLIVNGNVENRSNQGNILVNGYLYVAGDYRSFTGNVSLTQDVFGVGDVYACGAMTSNGASTIFGTTIDCTDTDVPCVASNLLCPARVNISPYGDVGWCNGTKLTATLTNAAATDLLTWESSANLTTWGDAGNAGKLLYQWGTGALPELIANPVSPTYYRAKITRPENLPETPGCATLSFIAYVKPGENRWRGIEEVPEFQESGKPDDWNNDKNWCAFIPTSTSPLTRINTGNPTIYDSDVAEVNAIELFAGTSIKLNGTSPTLNIYGNVINNGEIADILGSGTVNFKGNSTLTLTGSGLYRMHNVSIESGLTISFPVNPGEIEISGDIDFDGTALFIEGGSEITLTGGNDQDINANGNQFWNFNLLKSSNANVNLTSEFNLLGRMEMFNPSTVNSDGNLYIRSRGVDTRMDGSIGRIPSTPTQGAVTGNVTVERYMDPIPGEPYRYIASPVAGGFMPSPAVGRLYRYDPAIGWIKDYNPMPIGTGYAALTWDTSAQITWEVTGTTDSDSFTWPVFATAGWYLLGNPFPAAISWTSSFNAGWSREGIASTIAITDNHEVNYPTYFRYFDYAGVPPTSWGFDDITNGIIAMGQAFWVYANAGSQLTVHQAAKANANDEGSFYRTSGNSDYDQLAIIIDNGSFGDQTYLRLHEKATNEFDFNHDLPKLWNEKMNVFLVSESNREMLMHTLKEVPSDVKIPVGVKVTEPGEYHISFGTGESSNLSGLYLIDQYEGVAIPVSNSEPYAFVIKDAGKAITDRFYLSLSSNLEWTKETTVSIFPNPVNDQLNIRVDRIKENATATLIDLNGKVLVSSDFKGDGTIDMTSYPAGMYILKVKTEKGLVTKKIVKQE